MAAASLGELTISRPGHRHRGRATRSWRPRGESSVRGRGVAARPVATPGGAPQARTRRRATPADEPPAPTLEELLAELDALVGLEAVKTEVRHQTQLLRIQALRGSKGLRNPDLTRHLVFVGNPGTGKTTVARLVAGIYRAVGLLPKGHLVECDRSELVAGYLGQTALKTAEVIERALGGALFIDEAYALAGDEFGSEAIDTLVKEMEDHRGRAARDRRRVPRADGDVHRLQPGARSRFRLTLLFDDYSDDELVEIFTRIAGGADFTPTEDALDVLRGDARGRRRATRGSATAGSCATCSSPRSSGRRGGSGT